MSAIVDELVEKISGLTLTDAAELKKALETNLVLAQLHRL